MLALSAACAMGLLLASTSARAQVSDIDKGTARQLTLDGFDALDKKDYAAAADRFERADALFHAPTISVGLGRARLALGKLVSAKEAFSRAVYEPLPANASPAVLKAVEEARRELDALTPRVPMVIVNVKGAANPTVTVDGVEVPAAALGVKRPLDPGQHVVLARAKGFAPAESNFTIAEGNLQTVNIDLVPGDSGPEPEKSPPATGATTASGAADHGGAGHSSTKTLGYVGIGLGGAGLVVGAVAGAMAMSKNSTLSSECPGGHCNPNSSQKSSIQSDLNDYNTLTTVSTVGFIAGGALAATGVVLWLTAPTASSSGATVTPVVSLGYLGVRGSF
jgi:hypothetical protein